jgi:hypothetical protein
VIRINVDLTNPGQFFGCCGLLELADRLWPGAQGWFDATTFFISGCDPTEPLAQLVHVVTDSDLIQLDPDNATSSPMLFRFASNPLRLDWWEDDRAGGRELKVWAGTMDSVSIARSMANVLRQDQFSSPDLFNIGQVVRDIDEPSKKREPFYFDARRAPNAHSRDIGFSPNSLEFTTHAYPAVEFFCLVGLQRCLPVRTSQPRIFDYSTWLIPLSTSIIPAAVAGILPMPGCRKFRFENWYRTGQRKHKAFRAAIPIY